MVQLGLKTHTLHHPCKRKMLQGQYLLEAVVQLMVERGAGGRKGGGRVSTIRTDSVLRHNSLKARNDITTVFCQLILLLNQLPLFLLVINRFIYIPGF